MNVYLPQFRVPYATAMQTQCPRCGAAIGARCIGRRSPPQVRKQLHAERYQAAEVDI